MAGEGPQANATPRAVTVLFIRLPIKGMKVLRPQ